MMYFACICRSWEENVENGHKKRVLLLYKAMIPSVRLCGHCQLDLLARQGKIDYRHGIALKVSARDLAWADVVLMCRLDHPLELRLAKLLKQFGKALAYVLDDDLLNVPPGFSSSAYYALPDTKRAIAGLMAESQALISPSMLLLEKYGAGKVTLLAEEPAIDPIPFRPRRADGPIRIGFAGSIDRAGDVETILKNVLPQLKADYGARVRFVFFGAVPAFAQALGAECVPYCASYDEYRATLNSLDLDVGLAPLPDTPFHSCKHYNKFVEYAASGIVGIFSDVKPYDRLRTQFSWPYLCKNQPEAWLAMLKALIDHPEELERQKRRLAELTDTVFSVETSAAQLDSLLDALYPAAPQQADLGRLRRFRAASMVIRLWEALKRHGWRVLSLAIARLKAHVRRNLP